MEDSNYFVESKLDLGLGLSIGGCDSAPKAEPEQRGRFSRIFRAHDTCSIVTSSSSASSSTSSVCSSSSRANTVSWTQRYADSVGGGSNCASESQVVGWPPVRVSRMNSIGKREKLDIIKCSSTFVGTSRGACENINANLEERGRGRSSLYVKVNMDGIPIGRKVNLIAHTSYESLVQMLEDMFEDLTTSAEGSGLFSNLLGGFSKYALTYEDKDGDWMLVGDVPWGLFLNSVRRLRILRSRESNQT